MPKKNESLPLKINILGHAYNDAFHFIIPLLLPFFQIEFSFTYLQSGLILTFREALYSLFSLISGLLTDRFGYRYLIIALGFICSSLLLGNLLWANNIILIIIILLLMSIFESTFHPLATAIVGEKSQPGKQGRDLSLFSAAGTIGLVIMSLIFGWLVQLSGWRFACLIIAFPGLLIGWSYGKIQEKKIELKTANTKSNFKSWFFIFFFSKGMLCLGTKVFTSFLPIYITSHIGVKPGVSAFVISFYFLGLSMGSFLISKIIDNKSPLLIAIFSIASISVLIYALTYYKILIIIIAIVGAIGLMEGACYPSHNTWLNVKGSSHNRGSLFGFDLFIEGLSATVSPTLYGWIADTFGIVITYRLMILPILISLLFNLLLFRIDKKNYM